MIVETPDDLVEFNDWAVENRWSDGLPLIPPTERRVAEMLAGTEWPADTVIGPVPPRQGIATVEIIAVNAVMAGCKPAMMPVLITAVRAILEPAVNLYNIQGTTHPAGLMVMVSGPLADKAGMHCGMGLFGPGFPANATLGRAVRLIQMNVGGARPGETDMATQGSPAKFSFSFSENERDCPWEPYRVSQGFASDESIVTVFGGEGPRNIRPGGNIFGPGVDKNPGVITAEGILYSLATTIAVVTVTSAFMRPADMVVLLGSELAQVLADDGYGRSDVQQYLFQRARVPHRDWRRSVMYGIHNHPKYLDAADDDFLVALTDSVADIHVIVAGGGGHHNAWVPAFGNGHAVSKRVENPDGSAMSS